MATPKRSPAELRPRGRKRLELPSSGYGVPDPTTDKGKADDVRLGATYHAAEEVVLAGESLDSDDGGRIANEVYRRYCEQHGLEPRSDANVRKMRSKWTKVFERDLAGPYFGMNLETYVRQFVVIPEEKLRSDLQGYATNMIVTFLEYQNGGDADARQQAVKTFVSWALRSYRADLAATWGKVPAAWLDHPEGIPRPDTDDVATAWRVVIATMPIDYDRHAFRAAAYEQLGPCPEGIARNIVHT